jgi:hypothetical protein
MSKVILQIKNFQNSPYLFKVNHDLKKELYNCENRIISEDEIFELSLKIEPRK